MIEDEERKRTPFLPGMLESSANGARGGCASALLIIDNVRAIDAWGHVRVGDTVEAANRRLPFRLTELYWRESEPRVPSHECERRVAKRRCSGEAQPFLLTGSNRIEERGAKLTKSHRGDLQRLEGTNDVALWEERSKDARIRVNTCDLLCQCDVSPGEDGSACTETYVTVGYVNRKGGRSFILEIVRGVCQREGLEQEFFDMDSTGVNSNVENLPVLKNVRSGCTATRSNTSTWVAHTTP